MLQIVRDDLLHAGGHRSDEPERARLAVDVAVKKREHGYDEDDERKDREDGVECERLGEKRATVARKAHARAVEHFDEAP